MRNEQKSRGPKRGSEKRAHIRAPKKEPPELVSLNYLLLNTHIDPLKGRPEDLEKIKRLFKNFRGSENGWRHISGYTWKIIEIEDNNENIDEAEGTFLRVVVLEDSGQKHTFFFRVFTSPQHVDDFIGTLQTTESDKPIVEHNVFLIAANNRENYIRNQITEKINESLNHKRANRHKN